jgi:hypothetical protein
MSKQAFIFTSLHGRCFSPPYPRFCSQKRPKSRVFSSYVFSKHALFTDIKALISVFRDPFYVRFTA